MPAPNASPVLIESALTVAAIGLACRWPRLGEGFFHRIEQPLGRLAVRPGLAVSCVGAAAVVLRLILLPLMPIPQPFGQDDFSFLLAANTFALGRLTNPTPALWTHFESFHIDMQPTYMSMYFPAQGLTLAAGKVLFGHPWFGLLIITGLMCAALCWMLQVWLPPRWAFCGAMIAVVHLALFSYWINTYTGAASVAALGGALLLGAYPRIVRARQATRRPIGLRNPILLALGIVLVALSRPYEGLLVSLPVAIGLARWMLFAEHRPRPAALLRPAAVPIAILLGTAIWMGHYDQRVNGSALTLPYSVNRATYAVAPYWIWQSERPLPAYRHAVMRDYYLQGELPIARRTRTPSGFLAQLLAKPVMIAWFLAGIALLPPLLWLPRALCDGRMRFFLLAGCIWVPGLLIQIFLLPHYIAVFTAPLYCIALQAMRHMRASRLGSTPGNRATGIALTRNLVAAVIVMVVLRAFATPLHLRQEAWPGSAWAFSWYGPGQFGAARARVEAQLEALPGKQLVLVRYSPTHFSANEWVSNAPDLDTASVIWAREMDPDSNRELIQHYNRRRVWLVEPDAPSPSIAPYTPVQWASWASTASAASAGCTPAAGQERP